MKKLALHLTLVILFAFNISLFAFNKSDDLNKIKMQTITKEILEIFVNSTNREEQLKKFISDEWIEKNRINMKKYKINNYSPTAYEILFTEGDICAVSLGGSGWQHIIVFKFTEEFGKYKVLPKGISKSNAEYIDPWWYVKEYVGPKNDDK